MNRKDRDTYWEARLERKLTLGNFFNPSSPSFLGGGISPIIPELIGTALGGPIGGAIAGGVYGGISSGGGFSGALSGGLQGYGLGSLAGNAFPDAFGGGGMAGDFFGSGGSGGNFFSNTFGGGSGPEQLGGPGFNPGGSSGGGSFFDDPMAYMKKLMTGGIGGGAGPLSNLTNIGSGLYGLMQGRQMAAPGQQANAELTKLMQDPNYIRSMPGYDAGIQAVNRGMAAGGYIGSGNQMTALQDYGGKFYNDTMARLSGVGGTANAGLNLQGNALNRLAMGFGGMNFPNFGGGGSSGAIPAGRQIAPIGDAVY